MSASGRDILTEAVSVVFANTPNPSPEQVAKGLAEILDVQQEWGVAEYAGSGLDSILFRDYEPSSVHRKLLSISGNEDCEDDVVDLGIVTRLFTRWRKV